MERNKLNKSQKKNNPGPNPVRDANAVSDNSQTPIDVSLINHALKLSYEERIEAHESARQLMSDLEEAGRNYYAQQSKSTP